MTASSSRLARIVGQSHLPALDALRAVSVLMVIVGHFGYRLAPAGLGVSAFFVLSGFLITLLLFREAERTGGVSLRGFYLRRSLRIFPAYYVFVVLAAGWDLVHSGHVWPLGERIAALTYTMNYQNAMNGHSSAIAHAWSLAVEEQFYLLWPVLFLAIRRRGARTQVTVTSALLLLVAAWRSWLFLARGVGSAYVYNAFDTRFDNLLMGCLLAIVLRLPRVAASAERLAAAPWLPLVTVAALLASVNGPHAWHYSFGLTVDAALVAVLIVQLLLLHDARGWRWMAWRPVVYLGTISYPMYLYHLHGLDLGAKLHRWPHAGQLLVGAAATVALATGSYFVVEKPFLRLKSRLGRPAAARVAGPVSVAA